MSAYRQDFAEANKGHSQFNSKRRDKAIHISS